MAYNEISTNGQTVQGHRYEGGGLTYLNTQNIYDQHPQTFTVSDDGVLNVNFAKNNVSYNIALLINGVETRNAYFNYNYASVGVITGVWEVAVKKGDVITIQSNALSTEPFWVRWLLAKYR